MNFIQDPIRWSPLTDVVDGYSPTLPHLKGLQNGDTATSAIKQVTKQSLSQERLVLSHVLYAYCLTDDKALAVISVYAFRVQLFAMSLW